MIKAYNCAMLSAALGQLKSIIKANEERGVKTVVFCEDRLSLAAERTVCSAVEGTFLTSVYTFSRFLACERGKAKNVLSAQGSAMAIRKIIEENRERLTLFKKLSAASAAQTVYDTIALLYSSRISAEDVAKAAVSGGLLGGKLHDLAVIYGEYTEMLEESGRQDRNGYLRQLGEVIENSSGIRGSSIVFLGFQAFTSTTEECVRAAFGIAESVYGLFIGGAEPLYVNEALPSFCAVAKDFGGAEISSVPGGRLDEAEILRRSIFEPDSFYSEPKKTARVHIFEATDEEEELEFIAASIKKHVLDGGKRYAEISVMLPDLENGERALARVFSRYRIPYYADRQMSLAEHPICSFILGWLSCVNYGCRPQDVDGVVSSPFFPSPRADKDIFRNYLLRLGNFRGGVKREPNAEILEHMSFDFAAVTKVRDRFMQGYNILSGAVKTGICGGIRRLLECFGAEKKLRELAENFRDEKPAEAQFCARAADGVFGVLDEAESLADEGMPTGDFVKILKSGFSAMKISLIPPKADAVFVGDLSLTANTGSDVVFAARLTGEVPSAGADTALLTDTEIAALEGVNLNISPKLRQVNARRKEFCALNICAFREHLYLTYPVQSEGGETGASEIIDYASAVFAAPSGGRLRPVDLKRIEKSGRAIPYYCSEKLPAIRFIQKNAGNFAAESVREVLYRKGFADEADRALSSPSGRKLTCGRRLYLSYNSITPTALESYFSCPYLGFLRQGLRVREREEGAVRAIDTGNFIHAVLQDLAPEVNGIDGEEALKSRAKELAEIKLSRPPYSSLSDSESGRYTAEALVAEAVKVSEGMYAQLKNSSFTVVAAESKCEIRLSEGVKLFGRIDRVDESGDMVRIIDYKTGTIDCSAAKYYSGTKLQLPLYLLCVSDGKRAAGAYYFPAAVEYKEKADGVFRLRGFMDGSDEVVSAADNGVLPKKKSDYVDAYLSGRKLDGAMTREEFADFLDYAGMVADGGVREMLEGNVAPSPSEGVCKYCKAGGSCGFAAGRDGAERKVASIKCTEIAALVKKIKEGGNG